MKTGAAKKTNNQQQQNSSENKTKKQPKLGTGLYLTRIESYAHEQKDGISSFTTIFVGCTALMLLYFLACGGTWRCEQTLFCAKIVKRHL